MGLALAYDAARDQEKAITAPLKPFSKGEQEALQGGYNLLLNVQAEKTRSGERMGDTDVYREMTRLQSMLSSAVLIGETSELDEKIPAHRQPTRPAYLKEISFN